MGRLVLATVMGLFLVAAPAFAADAAADATSDLAVGAGSMVSLIASVPAAVAAPVAEAGTGTFTSRTSSASLRSSSDFTPHRPAILPALYLGSAALQGYDAYSTMTALKLGGHEANPLMKGAVNNPGVLIGLKAAVTATSMLAAEKMWKHHNRVGAIVVMAISNGMMTAVAMHNAGVVNSLR